ncbi:hypothetical protein OIO90_005609 [Microbotryomycetes sp. JL221]|nr:hypothetical protein OIO90_005609 [Microbotryomycetes sp. JL221]
MSHGEYQTDSPNFVHKAHFEQAPYANAHHYPHHLSPSRSHHSSPIVGAHHGSSHVNRHAAQHLPPRSYPTSFEIPPYGEPVVDGYSMVAEHSAETHLASPMVGPPSRGPTPTPMPVPPPPQPGSGYYTTAMLPGQDRMMPPPRHLGVEPGAAYHGTPILHHHAPATPELVSHHHHGHIHHHHLPPPHHLDPQYAPHPPSAHSSKMAALSYAPSLKVVQWTPQHGDEGTQVTIILDHSAINAAHATPYSLPSFGPGSPAIGGSRARVTRRFVVMFGQAPAPTKFTRAQAIDGNGVGQSMNAGPNEEDAFVILTTFVPARHTMGSMDERVMVLVRVVDEHQEIVEECIVGEWDPVPMSAYPATPSRYRKRPGEELLSDRMSPALRSPVPPPSPRRGVRGEVPSPAPRQTFTPAKRGRSTSAAVDESHIHREGSDDSGNLQPELLRTSQIVPTLAETVEGQAVATFSSKAVLKLHGDLNQMAMGWSNEEWTNRRRLIQFWRQQEGNVINASFRPISQSDYVPNTIVVSCIFRDEWNECFVTSVDTIYLLEALVGVRFSVEEKNRIRRNLEGFKPMTVSKTKADSEPFFKLIMGFPNPKPRNIEKDVKVFQWKVLAGALEKIIGKYSATYIGPSDGVDDQGSVGRPSEDGESRARSVPGSGGFSSVAPPSPAVPARIGGSLRGSPAVGNGEFSPPRASSMRPPHIMPPPASPIAGSKSQPTSPHVPQGPATMFNRSGRPLTLGAPANLSYEPLPAQSGGPVGPSTLSTSAPPAPVARGHSRPGSFDFNSILDASSFAEPGEAASSSEAVYGGDMRNHSRAWSEGPRRDAAATAAPANHLQATRSSTPLGHHSHHQSSSTMAGQGSYSAGATPYMYPGDFYGDQGPANETGSWNYDASGVGLTHGTNVGGSIVAQPLRRSISLEGLRPSSSGSQNASAGYAVPAITRDHHASQLQSTQQQTHDPSTESRAAGTNGDSQQLSQKSDGVKSV